MSVESSQQPDNISFNFQAGGTLYRLHDDATEIDIYDQLTARLTQLNSMLSMVIGEGFDMFSNHSDQIQSDYLWTCAMLTRECQELASCKPCHANELK
jgi:hypothetical protein